MLLETERLFMRPVRPSDAQTLFGLHTDPLVVEMILSGRPMTRAESDARLELYIGEWKRLGFGFWMAYEKQANGDLRFVGRCGLRDFDGDDVELGYCFSTAGSGRGLATEAAKGVIRAAFEHLQLERLVAVVRPSNTPSQRIMDKLGFTFGGMRSHHGTNFRFYELPATLARSKPELQTSRVPAIVSDYQPTGAASA